MIGKGMPRAILLAPNGKSYFVKERDHIGTQKGTIRKITAEGIEIREFVMNVLGKEDELTSFIPLTEENANQEGGMPGLGVPIPGGGK